MFVQTVLFAMAVVIAGLIFIISLIHENEHNARLARLRDVTLLAVPVLALSVLSALHARGTVELGWFFGTETSDIGPIEFGTAIFFGVSSILLGLIALRSSDLNSFVYFGAAAACLFIAGEEISWGQWLFHWETPAAMAAVNLQQETNLHNLVDPRIYDPIYSVAGAALLICAMVAAVPAWREAASAWSFRTPGFAPLGNFILWLGQNAFGLGLVLSTACFLQHESFEEYAEFLLGSALLAFLVSLLRQGSSQSTISVQRS
jgi:hypothetical protein